MSDDGLSSRPRRSSAVKPLALAAVFFAVSAVTALNYALLPGEATLQARRGYHAGILEKRIETPERYRVLAPMLVEGPTRMLERWMPREDAFDCTYAVFYVLALAAFLASLFAYVRIWFPDETSLLGVLFVAAILPIATRPNEYGPHSMLEPTFVSLALLCTARDRRLWLALIIAAASLNRETGIFLVLLYAVAKPLDTQRVTTTAVYAAIWLAVFIGLRLYGGDAPRYWTLAKVFSSNLTQLWETVFNVAVLCGVLGWFAVAWFRHAPPFVRRVATVVPVYLAVIAVFGIWREVRLLLPVIPLLLPLALSRLERPLRVWMVTAIVISAAITPAVRYSFFTPLRESRIAAHEQIVAHTASPPARDRVLVPMLLDGAIAIASTRWPPEKAFERVYAAFHLAASSFLVFALILQLRLWFPTEQAAAGALIVASLLQLALRQQEFDLSSIPRAAVFAPHSLLEPICVALACVLAQRRAHAWLSLLMAVAALNSEASVILPAVYLAVVGIRRSSAVMAAWYGVIWLIVTLGLRLLPGGTEATWTLRDLFDENLRRWPIAAVNVWLFLGPLWIAALIGLRRAPEPARRAAWLVPPCMLAVAIVGQWADVRLLLGLYPLLMPLVLSAVFEPVHLRQRAILAR